MDRATAVARIQERFGFTTNLDTEIVAALQDSQAELEQEVELPWFLISEISSITTTAAEERIPVPTDFLREVDGDALWYYNSTATADEDKWVELGKDKTDFLRATLPGSGPPEAYSLQGEQFRIFPTPDDTYTIKLVYYKQDQVLTSNVENQWLKYASDLMIGEAGVKIAIARRDQAAMQFFSSLLTRARTRLVQASQAREDSNMRYVMGGPD